MRRFNLLLSFILVALCLHAQDELLDLLDDASSDEYVSATFKRTSELVGLPSKKLSTPS